MVSPMYDFPSRAEAEEANRRAAQVNYQFRDELTAIRERDARQQVRLQAWGQADGQMASDAASIWSRYPWFPVRLVGILAKEGYGADNPVVQRLASTVYKWSRKPDWTKQDTQRKAAVLAENLAQGVTPGAGRSLFSEDYETSAVASGTPNAPRGGGGGGVLGVMPPGSILGSQGAQNLASVGQAVETVASVAKPAVRGAAIALQTPYEVVQGQLRERARAVSELAQGEIGVGNVLTGLYGVQTPDTIERAAEATTAGQIAIAASEGRSIETGSGFFLDPSSEISQAQAEAARRQFEVYGQGATLGRLYAAGAVHAGIIDPDDTAYRVASGVVDAAAVLFLDPTNIGLGSGAKGAKAARSFAPVGTEGLESAGLINGVRRWVQPVTFDQWLTTPEGTRTIDAFATSKNYEWLRDATGDATLAFRLKDADTPAQVLDVLKPAVGITPNPSRTFAAPPIDPADDPWNALARAVGGEVTSSRSPGSRILEEAVPAGPRLTEVPRPSYSPVAKIVDRFLPSLSPHVKSHPGTSYQTFRPFDQVRMLHDMPGGAADINDVNQMIDTFDLVQRNAKLPRVVRETNNELLARAHAGGRPAIMPVVTKVMDDIAGKLVAKGMDRTEATNMTRVFVDSYEKARVYAIDQFGNAEVPPFLRVDGDLNPLAEPTILTEFLNRAIPIPDTREIRKATSALAPIYRAPFIGKGIKGSTLALDFAYSQVFKPLALVTRLAYPVRVIGEEQIRIAAAGYDSMFHHPISYVAWMASRKGTMTEDDLLDAARTGLPGGEEFGQAMSRRSGVNQLLNEPGEVIRLKQRAVYARGEDRHALSWAEQLQKFHADPVVHNVSRMNPAEAKAWFFEGAGVKFRAQLIQNGGGWEQLTSRQASDEYVDWIYDQVKMFTGQDDDLTKAIVTGKLGDDVLVEGTPAGPRVNKKVQRELQRRSELGEGPQYVPGDAVVHGGRRTKDAWDDAIQHLFSGMMGRPTDRMSRSPVFRQAYWERAEHLSSWATDDADTILAKIEKLTGQPPPKKVASSIRARAGKARDGATLTFDQVDHLAKAYALETTKDLLYDLSKRNQFFDTVRFLIPFGDAFKEVMTTWAKLAKRNPRAPYMGYRAIEGAQESGFFHKDPVTGEEMFTYPGSDLLIGQLAGVPISLAGPVANLNLLGNGLPGVGPAVQIPAKYLLPVRDESNALEEWLFPFGRGEKVGPVNEVINALLPAWVDKARAALGEKGFEEIRAKTTVRLAMYLKSTGNYEDSPEGYQRLLADAKAKTTQFLWIQAAAQNIAPSTPLPEWKVLDRDGKLIVTALVTEEFNKVRTKAYDEGEDGDAVAMDWLVETFGADIFMAVQGISQAMVPGLEATEAQYKWVNDHPDLIDEFPQVARLFAPRGGEFSLEAYQQQLDSGAREIPDPETTVRLANDHFARYLYNKEKGLFEDPDDEAAAYLREYKAYLMEAYPGYNSQVGVKGRATPDELIAETRRALDNDTLAKTPVGKALTEYLAERDWVTEEAAGRDISSWWTAQSTSDLVLYLSDYHTYLAEKYPGSEDALRIIFGRDISGLEDE